MPIFMKAGSIQGDVEASSYRNWVVVDSCKYEIKFHEDDVRKSVEDGAPDPDLGLFEVEKSSTDRSGPALMQWMVNGDKLETVQFDVCGDALKSGQWRCNTRYILKDVVLTDYSVDMQMSEAKAGVKITLKLRYDELSVEQFRYDETNTQKTRARSTVHRRPE